jgi:hypothetical protein
MQDKRRARENFNAIIMKWHIKNEHSGPQGDKGRKSVTQNAFSRTQFNNCIYDNYKSIECARNNKCDWELFMDTKGDKSIIFLINFHRYDIKFNIFSNSTNSLNVATNLMGELPLDSNITLPRDLYDQELILIRLSRKRSSCLYCDF